ncbi:MAG: xanthine dehydrogenase family protein molybdopterin-binding subunit [Chloroflexi bacterium]|nr:xanthine dehydrogenase family protein molybdopterin-binding subunit [Chloroflexota bacterium]
MSGGAATAGLVADPRPRREDPRLLTGQGSYVADVRLPGMLEAAFVRSPLAHARIRAVDTDAARAAPGVIAVLTGADLSDVEPFPDLRERTRPVRQRALCIDRVRYVGAPLAVVVAEDRYLAEDAAELVDADLEELPVVADMDAALAPGAPLLYDDWPDDRIVATAPVDPELDAIFETHQVVRGTYRMQRHTAMPMETRGVVATVERGRLLVWTSTQVPHVVRTVIARTLGLPEHRIRVVAGDVGGGFGSKLHVYPEEVVIPALAWRLRRPVRWIEDRREHFLASSHARHQRHDLEAAVDERGDIVAVRGDLVCDVGSGEILPPGVAPAFVSAGSITGPYRFPRSQARLTCVVTNKTPSGAYRGFGTPEIVFALERLLERVARETGQDPVELRRRHLIRPEDLPYETPNGRRIDSGSHLEAFERAVAWAETTRERLAPTARGSIGVGYANYIEGVSPNYHATSGLWAQQETSTLRIEPDGTVVVASGLGPMGQGTETMLATLASQLLGVPHDQVEVRLGDTDLSPYGLGSFGSRSTVVAAGAVQLAAGRLLDKVRTIAGHLLEASATDIELVDGRARVVGSPDRSVGLAEVAHLAYFRTFDLPPGTEPGLEATGAYEQPGVDHRPNAQGKLNICLTYANSTHACVVDVDRATGVVRLLAHLAVHDAGLLLNPQVVDGQIMGGVAQGIGGALYEQLLHDADGQPLVTSFMDYLVPGAPEVPELTIDHLSTPSTTTPFGLKGAGEAGATGVPAAIANAVCDALRDTGIDITQTPITPSSIRAALRATPDPTTTEGS